VQHVESKQSLSSKKVIRCVFPLPVAEDKEQKTAQRIKKGEAKTTRTAIQTNASATGDDQD